MAQVPVRSRDAKSFGLLAQFLVLPQIATLLSQTNRVSFVAHRTSSQAAACCSKAAWARLSTDRDIENPVKSILSPFLYNLFFHFRVTSSRALSFLCKPLLLSTPDAVIPNRIKPPQ